MNALKIGWGQKETFPPERLTNGGFLLKPVENMKILSSNKFN